MNAIEGKKASYYTLGCKLNFAETSSIGAELRKLGVTTVGKGELADICIINTCSVTEVADSKCRQAIGRLVRRHPGALVVVTGCYAQLQPERVAGLQGVERIKDKQFDTVFVNKMANAVSFSFNTEGLTIDSSYQIRLYFSTQEQEELEVGESRTDYLKNFMVDNFIVLIDSGE